MRGWGIRWPSAETARPLAAALLNSADGHRVPAYDLAILYAGLGDADAAFGQLARAFETRDTALDTLNVEPRFANLRSDARFANMVERLGLSATSELVAT